MAISYLGQSIAGIYKNGLLTAEAANSVTSGNENTGSTITPPLIPGGNSSYVFNGTTIASSSDLINSMSGADISLSTDVTLPTTTVTASSLGDSTSTAVGIASSNTPTAIATPNILHNYPTYTYRFALMMLSPTTYNTMMQSPANFQPQNVLIASAGMYGQNSFSRNQYFQEDFYFENIEIDTIIGLNSETRGTNAISVKFDVIEPYGCSLINRLMDATAQLNGFNYLTVPYLLRVDFVGYDTDGTPVTPIPGTVKYIPIKLIQMKFNYTEKGSVYKFDAIPVNHDSYNETHITIPANFEIVATTVKDFFNSVNKSDWTMQYSAAQQRKETNIVSQAERILQLQGATTDNQIQAVLNAQANTTSSTDSNSKTFTVNGISDSLNQYYKSLEKNNSQLADQIAFVFDDDIAAATITIPDRTDIKQTQMLDAKNFQSKSYKLDGARSSVNQGANQGAYTIDYKTNAFRVNAGTSIIDLINNIIRNSSYITNQLTDPTAATSSSSNSSEQGSSTSANSTTGTTSDGSIAAGDTASSTTGQSSTNSSTNANKPYYHWKIVPQVELLSYDKIRNKYAKKITFHVKKYTMYNIRYPFAPKGKAVNYVKDYQYLFTGQNSDILDLDMNFEALFYTAVTSFPAQTQNASAQTSTDVNNPLVKGNMIPTQGVLSPDSYQPVANNMSAISPGHASKDNKTTMAADLTSNLMSKAQADMLSISMTIIGDPDFIKQDDIFYISSANGLGGSLNMDGGEVDVRLIFKSGGDYDTATGRLSTTTYQATKNVFNGLYRVLQVTSTFSEGEFKQKLSMIRLPNQPSYDYVSPVASSTSTTTPAERSSSGVATVSDTTITDVDSSSDGQIATAKTTTTNSVPDLDVTDTNINPPVTPPTKTLPQGYSVDPQTGLVRNANGVVDRDLSVNGLDYL